MSWAAAPVVRDFVSLESDACGVGHFNNGSLVLWVLYNDVNFALAQSLLKQGQHFDFLHESLLWLGGVGGVCGGGGLCGVPVCGGLWANQQVNVAAFFGVVHTRAKQPHCRALAKCGSGGLAYGLNLVGTEAHGNAECVPDGTVRRACGRLPHSMDPGSGSGMTDFSVTLHLLRGPYPRVRFSLLQGVNFAICSAKRWAVAISTGTYSWPAFNALIRMFMSSMYS